VDDGGKKAITHYKVLSYNPELDCSSVELSLETGRTNQIRVQLASKGHAVVGDRKYGQGNQNSPIDRLCLHARLIEFIHPVLEQKVSLEAPIPKEFRQFK
jgi:23S rRNA pseudouridine1911/1915/1917 synthase